MTETATVVDIVLGVSVFAVALLAVAVPRRTAAVILFLVFGVVLSVVWARLGAPDIAIAEAVLGAGITGALLVDAIGGNRPSRTPERGSPGPGAWCRVGVLVAGGLAGAALATILMVAVLQLGTGEVRLGDTVAERLPESGVDHGITAVLLNFRSYDTLLEVAVLAVAALGALAVRGGPVRSAASRREDVPMVVDGLVRLLAPVVVVLAGWILVAGSDRPGGAFQAGALGAAGMILLHVGARTEAFPTAAWWPPAVVSGLLAFLALAFITRTVGATSAGSGWLVLDPSWAGAAILGLEAVLAAGIAAGLVLFFVANDGAGERRATAGAAPSRRAKEVTAR